MNDIKPRRKPIGLLIILTLSVFMLTPYGSKLMRTSVLSMKNGNLVGQTAPSQVDGETILGAQLPIQDEAPKSWTLWTFFSPT